MLDLQHLPGNLNNQRQQVFIGENATGGGAQWRTWIKPKGINWVHIFLVGKGGNGGAGAVGANSTAAGGGGGGSGGQTSILAPAWCLPDTLYLSIAGVAASAYASYVTNYPATANNYVVALAQAGVAGGNAAGATAGTAGAAGAASSPGACPIASYIGASFFLAGQAGIIGGTTVSGGAQAIPSTGLRVMGGTGGGGLPAAATAGTTGGGIGSAGLFPILSAPIGQVTATSPPGTPDSGYIFQAQNPGVIGLLNYGGIGSGSTHGTATGGGLVQVKGGNGAPGCGGGGSGGALTGSTAAAGGDGGPGFCIISCW